MASGAIGKCTKGGSRSCLIDRMLTVTSTYGIGGGRIPYDVNAALVPAALRGIAALSAAGFFPEHPNWNETASAYAQVWEDSTLEFFAVNIPVDEARSLVEAYTEATGFGFPSHADNITSDVMYHGLALDGNNDQPIVKVMNTDDCFRTFLLNTTNQTQLTAFLNQTSNNILQPYPVGMSTPVGAIVANPAYGGDPIYAANFTNNAYHGVSNPTDRVGRSSTLTPDTTDRRLELAASNDSRWPRTPARALRRLLVSTRLLLRRFSPQQRSRSVQPPMEHHRSERREFELRSLELDLQQRRIPVHATGRFAASCWTEPDRVEH